MECLRCGSPMRFRGTESLQLGKAGVFTGVWSNIVSGALEVRVYQCEKCGKLELFSVEQAPPDDGPAFDFPDDAFPCGPEYAAGTVSPDGMPQRTCPQCGCRHDFDWPKCPKCGHHYYSDM